MISRYYRPRLGATSSSWWSVVVNGNCRRLLPIIRSLEACCFWRRG